MSVALTIAGIVGPALLLVLAVRRWIVPVRWAVVFLFLALTLAFLNGAVFTSKLPVPVDEVARGYPYRGVFGDIVARNPLTNDSVKLFLPWMQVAREELLHGRAPLWNRYAFSGYPLLANGESAPFSPLFLATLFVPLPKQIVAMAGLKIFLALLFGYLFLKRERLSDAAAVFGASAYAFSVFQTVFLYYSTTAVTALLPAALFALFHAMDAAAKRGVVLSAIVVGSLMASGHPESVFHIAIAAAALFAIDFSLAADRRAWIARFRFPLVGAAAGLLLSLPAWLPVAEQVVLSTRFAQLSAAAPQPPFPWTAAWAIVAPNGFGNPARHNWNWIRNYSTVATSYAGLLVLVAFIAAMFARRTTPRHRLWGVAAVAFLLTAMQWTIVGRGLAALPLMNVSANDKLRFAACFLAAAVAAKWIDSAASFPLFVAAGILPVLLAAYAVWRHPAVSRPQDLAGAIVVLALAAAMASQRLRTHAAAGAAVLCIVELFVFNVPFNALVDEKFYRPRLPIIEAIHKHAGPEPYRIAGFDWTLLPNASAQYGLEDVRGSDPMSFARYTDFLSLFTAQELGTDVRRVIDAEHPALDYLNVRYLLTEPGAVLGGKWKLVYHGSDGELYENTRVLPRFFGPSLVRRVEARRSMAEVVANPDFGRVAIETASRDAPMAPNAAVAVLDTAMLSSGRFALRVRASAPALVVSSEPWSRWWRADVDGRETRTVIVNGSFVGVYVPVGESRVALSYRPLTYYGATLAALFAVAGLAAWPAERRRSGSPPDTVE